jgi:hypothetical protein
MELMLGDGRTSLSARIDLDALKGMIQTHPFTRTGFITIIDAAGHQVFDPARTDLTDRDIVA